MTDTPLLPQEALSVGQILKKARLEQDLTLEHISQALNINKRQLSQLEEDEYSYNVYSLGFTKLYAQYLKLDSQEIVEKFKEQAQPLFQSSQPIFSAPQPGRGMPSFRVIFLSLILFAGLGIGANWVSYYSFSPPPQPEIPKDNKERSEERKGEEPDLSYARQIPFPNDLVQQTIIVPFSREETGPSENNAKDLKSPTHQGVDLKVTEEAWIEVKDKEGNIIVSKLFHPGDSFKFKNSEGFVLKTGNLKGTHLSSGNKVFPFVGKSGEVRRDIPLNPDKWLEHTEQSP
jgi:transcriptional regulator with XRE-family HTH domain